VPLRNLSFGFGIVLENPRFITCYDMSEKISVIFDAFQKVQAHIPSVFLFSLVRVLETALHKFSAYSVPRPECRGRLDDSNSTHY